MKFDPQKHHRRSIRIKEYDYAQPGGYFVTIVTYQRNCIFGNIVNEEIQLNAFGKIADECWRAPTEQFGKPIIGSIPTIIRTFKAAVTRRIGRELNATGVWQRNYYEHVIRNHEDWDRIHRYIESNPSMWAEDDENPMNM